jgi:hypothetical protein
MGEATITIKKGVVVLKAPKSELIEVSETHDGIAFNFKRGLQLYQVEQYMPSHIKQLIKNTTDSFEGNNIIIDLDDAKKPIMVDAT